MKKILLAILLFCPSQILALDEPSNSVLFPKITLKDGNILKNATVSKFDNSLFRISHDNGIGKFSWKDLPDEVLAKLQSTDLFEKPLKLRAVTGQIALIDEKGKIISLAGDPIFAMSEAQYKAAMLRFPDTIKIRIEQIKKRLVDLNQSVVENKEAHEKLEREVTYQRTLLDDDDANIIQLRQKSAAAEKMMEKNAIEFLKWSDEIVKAGNGFYFFSRFVDSKIDSSIVQDDGTFSLNIPESGNTIIFTYSDKVSYNNGPPVLAKLVRSNTQAIELTKINILSDTFSLNPKIPN